MKLHLDESSVLPGSSLTGFVVGLDADALVALEAVETTKGLVGDEASATSTVGSVIVPVGSNGRFTLAVPHDAVPQFHADFNWKGRSAYSRRSWNVRARSGDEFEAVERIELLAGSTTRLIHRWGSSSKRSQPSWRNVDDPICGSPGRRCCSFSRSGCCA